jgi:hypothetical protein
MTVPMMAHNPPIMSAGDGADFGVGVGAGLIVIASGVVCPAFTVAVVR